MATVGTTLLETQALFCKATTQSIDEFDCDSKPLAKDIQTSFSAARAGAMDLFFAVAGGNVEQAKALLSTRVDPNFRDPQQRCPLHIAAGFGNLEMIQILVDHGADVNVMDRWGNTPLAQSEVGGQAERLLKGSGAKMQEAEMRKTAQREKWEINRSEVKIGAVLTSTLKSKVHRATWQGVEVVAKFCLNDGPDSSEADSPCSEVEAEMLHEIALLATLRHPDLVLFLGCCVQEQPIMFITQFMPGGDLERYYASRRVDGAPRPAPTRTVNRWSRSILRALGFLHGCSDPIIHRDLKPMNILLTEGLDVKVTDFGISKAVSKYACSSSASLAKDIAQGGSMAHGMTGGVGSFRYMAPETARHEIYTEKVDIYAFGLILYFMSCGRQPFHQYKDAALVLKEYSEGQEPRPKVSECPKVFGPIMEASWNPVAEERPSASSLIEQLVEAHPGGNNACCTSM